MGNAVGRGQHSETFGNQRELFVDSDSHYPLSDIIIIIIREEKKLLSFLVISTGWGKVFVSCFTGHCRLLGR